jgi:hypothetical protein
VLPFTDSALRVPKYLTRFGGLGVASGIPVDYLGTVNDRSVTIYLLGIGGNAVDNYPYSMTTGGSLCVVHATFDDKEYLFHFIPLGYAVGISR